jgi:hypothetical protein
VLNLVPWGGVALRLPPVALADAEGPEEVSRRIADAYISDIVMHQVAATVLKTLTLKAPHMQGCHMALPAEPRQPYLTESKAEQCNAMQSKA